MIFTNEFKIAKLTLQTDANWNARAHKERFLTNPSKPNSEVKLSRGSKMKKFTNLAIVVGGGSETGLGAIRSLGRAGIDVYYVDDCKNITPYSKYCKGYFISPEVSHDKEELKHILLKIRHHVKESPVVFPAADLYALCLSDLMDELRDFYIMAPGREIAEILINKRRFYQSLQKAEIPIPSTHFPEDLENVRRIGKEISYPTFIKPCFSHLFRQRFEGGKKGFLANSQMELVKYCGLLMKTGIEVMIQEVILGPPTNGVFLDGYLDAKSAPKILFARQRLRMWPLDFGNSTACKSIPISSVAALKEPLFKYLKSVNYRGIFSAEFKKDERDDVFKMVEINSRTSGWFNTLSARCGANIMLVAYLDATGKDLEYSEDYKAGIKLIFPMDDIRASVTMFMKGDLSISEWISSLSGEKEYLPYAQDDAMPFLKDISSTIKSITKRTH